MRWLAWASLGLFVFCLYLLPGRGQAPAAKPAVKLPLTKVVLFNAGVGFFQRKGSLDGPGSVELSVDQEDVNDLLKTIIAEDADGSVAKSVIFDQKAGSDVALRAFALDLVTNPGLSHLLHQARGEKILVTNQDGSTVTGAIVSIEKSGPTVFTPENEDGQPIAKPVLIKPTADASDKLNLLADDGLQSLSIKQIKKVKFLNAELEAEFHKALLALAKSRTEGKKSVAVQFGGQGKRDVKIGYVAEVPLWKPNYRINLTGNDAKVQAWATVENATDEDWQNVSISLMSGRPMSFQMDLYDPLFLPRPYVEPEAFASLRPPMYLAGQFGMQGGGAFGLGGFGGGIGGGGFGGGGIGGNMGVGGVPREAPQRILPSQLAGQFGLQGFPSMRPSVRSLGGNRLTYDEFTNRLKQKAQEKNATHAGLGGGILSATSTINLGEPAEFKVVDPITLPRFKTALLPIHTGPAKLERVSIYNAATLATNPLLGLKVTNTSKQFLPAGPVAIYDDGSYAGEARLGDWKVDQSRWVSYAIDLLTSVQPTVIAIATTSDVSMIEDGVFIQAQQYRHLYPYIALSRQSRTLIIEHPIRPNQTLVTPEKPLERTSTTYRFAVELKPNERKEFTVVEKSANSERSSLIGMKSSEIEQAKSKTKSEAVLAVLNKLGTMRTELDRIAEQSEKEVNAIKAIEVDQKRLRENMLSLPKESETMKRIVKLFDTQETEIEKRRKAIIDLAEQAKTKDAEMIQFTKSANAK